MRKILSYCKSHIYDIHAVLVGFVLLVLIRLIRKKVRQFIANWINDKIKSNPTLLFGSDSMLYAWKFLWLIFITLSAVFGFVVLARLSPFVEFSLQSGLMGCVYALCGDAFFRQIFPDEHSEKDERDGYIS